jgi:hypothetical protein
VIDEHNIEVGPDRGERRSPTVQHRFGAPKGRASAPFVILNHVLDVAEVVAAQALSRCAPAPCPHHVSTSHCERRS